MKIAAALLVVLMPFPFSSVASDNEKLRVAYDLVEKMGYKKNLEKFKVEILLQSEKAINQLLTSVEVPPEIHDLISQHRVKRQKLIDQHIPLSDLETEMAQKYAQTFSKKEILELVSFYESPIGKKLILKMPDLTLSIQKYVRLRIHEIRPKLKEYDQSFLKEFYKVLEETKDTP